MKVASALLARDCAWLWDGPDDLLLGAACALPNCSEIVYPDFSRPGVTKFCQEAHRKKFERRRASLGRAVTAIEALLEADVPRAERRQLQSQLAWVRWLRDSQYPDAR